VREHTAAQFVDNPLTDPSRQPSLYVNKERVHEGQADDNQGQAHDHYGAVAQDSIIDNNPEY
jgi:hypothetical protein